MGVGAMEINTETIETACEAFYNDPSGLTNWERTTRISPTMANRYRAAMTRALETITK
jgi:hypothetical protein